MYPHIHTDVSIIREDRVVERRDLAFYFSPNVTFVESGRVSTDRCSGYEGSNASKYRRAGIEQHFRTVGMKITKLIFLFYMRVARQNHKKEALLFLYLIRGLISVRLPSLVPICWTSNVLFMRAVMHYAMIVTGCGFMSKQVNQ